LNERLAASTRGKCIYGCGHRSTCPHTASNAGGSVSHGGNWSTRPTGGAPLGLGTIGPRNSAPEVMITTGVIVQSAAPRSPALSSAASVSLRSTRTTPARPAASVTRFWIQWGFTMPLDPHLIAQTMVTCKYRVALCCALRINLPLKCLCVMDPPGWDCTPFDVRKVITRRRLPIVLRLEPIVCNNYNEYLRVVRCMIYNDWALIRSSDNPLNDQIKAHAKQPRRRNDDKE
jgi:hypothetical protein